MEVEGVVPVMVVVVVVAMAVLVVVVVETVMDGGNFCPA